MASFHPLLERQLKNSSLTSAAPPATQEAWADFLQQVSQVYHQADHDGQLSAHLLSLTPLQHETPANFLEPDDAYSLIRTVIDSLPDHIFAEDRDGRFILSNLAHSHSINASTEELLGRTALQVLPGDLAEQYALDDEATMARGESLVNVQRLARDVAGDKTWVSTTKVPLRNEDGDIIGLAAISRNIVEQKQTLEKLEEERNLLRTLIGAMRISNNMQDIICLINMQGMINYMSPSCLTTLGYSPEVLIGTSVFSRVHPDDLGQMRASIQKMGRAEYRYRHSNGQYLWVETLSSLVAEENASPTGVILAIRDITERKRTEEALQQSEERFRQLAENIDDMFWMSSPDFQQYIYISPAYEKIWGRSRESLYQQPSSILEALYPDDSERVAASLGKGFSDEYDEEYRIIRSDGTIRWIHTRAFPIRDSAGEIYRIAGISNDITEAKQLEHELQDLNRIKTEFLSTAAHELRTPLTSIYGFTEILLYRQLDETRSKRYLTLILDQSAELREIIDDLLDIVRLEANRALTLTLEPLHINDVIDRALAPFLDSDPNHSIVLDMPKTLPEVSGDRYRLSQVIKNLIANALKYSPQGGTVTLRVQALPEVLQISIHDAGIGMTAEQQSHLFEKFYRADSSNVTLSGTGLGLAISKLIVELHGGKIWAESTYQVGSTFYFTLPFRNWQS